VSLKRALLVGIDQYDKFSSLKGCVNDVMALLPLMSRNDDDSPNFSCQALTSDSTCVSRDALLREVDRLLAPGADIAVLYFAGHGGETARDVTLVVQDGTARTPGVDFSQLIGMIQESEVREIIVILDCCFSGGAAGVPQLGGPASVLRPGVTIMTASRADQASAETVAGRGVFSTYLEGGLDGGAADVVGKVTLAGLYAYLSESFGAWDQRPTFKTNVDRLEELRRCNPAVPLEELRELAVLFPAPDYEFPLDRSFEPTEEPRNADNERVFGILQHCRAAKLVEPVIGEHLYFAAMASQPCRLTPLGRHYRNLAQQDRL